MISALEDEVFTESELKLKRRESVCITIINSMDWHDPESAPETTRQDVLFSGFEVDGYKSSQFGPFGEVELDLYHYGLTPGTG